MKKLQNLSYLNSSFRVRSIACLVTAFSLIVLVPAMALISSSNGFTITSPSNGSTVGTKGLRVTWSPLKGAASYKLQLSSTDDPSFEGPDYSFRTPGTSWTKNVYQMQYIARVTAYDSNKKRIGRTPTIKFIASNKVANTGGPLPPATTSVPTSPSTTSTTTKPTTTVTTTAPTKPPVSNGGIWKPAPNTTWYWQINNKVNENINVTMYDVDLFEAVPSARTYTIPGFGPVNVDKGPNAGIIDRLHAKGKVVICYVDTGAAEYNRPDYKYFPQASQGTVAEASDGSQWDEKWLNTSSASEFNKWAPIMWARFDLAKSIGCDGIEADQNNHLGNDTGFSESVAIDTAWFLEVARQGHARGLSMGMKNGIEAVNAQTVAAFDWALNEECHQYDECADMQPFLSAGKAVFNAEYPKMPGGAAQTKACDKKPSGISTMGYPIELGGGYFYDCLTGLTVPTGTSR